LNKIKLSVKAKSFHFPQFLNRKDFNREIHFFGARIFSRKTRKEESNLFNTHDGLGCRIDSVDGRKVEFFFFAWKIIKNFIKILLRNLKGEVLVKVSLATETTKTGISGFV